MYAMVKKRSGRGVASEFHKLKGSDLGFKSFSFKDEADIAHANQTKLAELGFAPYVYSEVGKVRIGNTKALSKWGYITEVATTMVCGGNSCYCCDREDLESAYEEEIYDLVDQMEEHGWWFPDCHIGNVGYVYRNGVQVMVCIDAGDESVQSEDECYCITCRKGGCCHG